ncbi:MAG: ATP synthase F1 subunit gamma [Candidatus Margulisiibacteriota bacterium]|jgi:F-type H+-transporting ATPase subunit gamma
MSKINEIKKRIVAIKKNKKITQAMNMVAASKFRKAHHSLIMARPYSDKFYQIVADITQRLGDSENFFLKNEGNKVGLIVVAGDRGLCASFNSNIFRKSEEFISSYASPQDLELILVGTKTTQYFKNKDYKVVSQFPNFYDKLNVGKAGRIADIILDNYFNDNWREVYVIYNDFRSAISQKTIVKKILPPGEEFLKKAAVAETNADGSVKVAKEEYVMEYIYEPDQQTFLRFLLKKHIYFQMYRIFMESITSEQGSRMTAMEAATSNATEMIGSMTLRFNRERQSMITGEIAEIVGGAEALN